MISSRRIIKETNTGNACEILHPIGTVRRTSSCNMVLLLLSVILAVILVAIPEVDAEAAACIKVSSYDGLRLFGRWWVADVIARVFPTRREYIKSVISDIHPASVIPTGPYPNDKLVYRSDLVVEFRTHPHCEGLGELTPNDQPIYGVAVLHPEGEDPTAFLLTVRLTPHNAYLASKIIHQFESDELAPEPAPAASVTATPSVSNGKEETRTPEQKQSDLDEFDRDMHAIH